MKIIFWKAKTKTDPKPCILPALLLAAVGISLCTVQSFLPREETKQTEVHCDTVVSGETSASMTATSTSPAPDIRTAKGSSPASVQVMTPVIPEEEIPLSAQLQEFAYNLCEQEGVPYALVLAVIEHESNFDADAIYHNDNGTRDSGLMQLNDIVREHVKERFGVTDLLDPEQNITAGVGILSDYLEKYEVQEAVMAYAIGESGMQNAKQNGRHSTKATDEILTLMEKYASLL